MIIMKKTLVVLLAVALLGIAAYFVAANNTAGMAAAGPSVAQATAGYKDGSFSGKLQETPYGQVQVAAVIESGKITEVKFLKMPDDLGRSTELTNYAKPLLTQSTIKHQNAAVDFVSGATVTSLGYEHSLQAALDKAAL